jgi:hypothetical protein
VIRGHGGSLQLSNGAQRGLVVSVVLPKRQLQPG